MSMSLFSFGRSNRSDRNKVEANSSPLEDSKRVDNSPYEVKENTLKELDNRRLGDLEVEKDDADAQQNLMQIGDPSIDGMLNHLSVPSEAVQGTLIGADLEP